MSEWRSAPLSQLAETQLGKMLDQKKNQGSYQPYLGNANVQWGYVDLSEIKQMRLKDSELQKFRLRSGDLLVCEGGDPGRCALWNKDDEMYYQKALHRVRVGEKLDTFFLYYSLIHMGQTQEIRQYYTGGATIKHLPKAALNRVVISYPSLEIQRRIADILSAYDKLIDNNRKQIKLLEEAAQRLYKEWFIDLKFPGHETTPIDSTTNLPEGWRRRSLLSEVDIVRGKSYSSDDISIANGSRLLINLGNIKPFGGYRPGKEKTYAGTAKEEQIVKSRELIMAVTEQAEGLAGYAALVPSLDKPAIISMDLIKLLPKTLPVSYLYAALRYGGVSRAISPFANGAKIKHLKPAELSKVDIIIPDCKLSVQFDDIIDPLLCKTDALGRSMSTAQEARDRLLPKLMSGEIEV